MDLGLIDRNAVSRITTGDIAWEIVKHGPPGLRKDVKITSDPGSILSYRTKVYRWVIIMDWARHNTEKGGKFYLYTEPLNADATIVTDYLILQQFAMTIGNVEDQMVDRLHPENSLLTQFALPPAIANLPHPNSAVTLLQPNQRLGSSRLRIGSRKLPAVAPNL